MRLPWFELEIGPDEEVARMACAQGDDFVGAYLALAAASGTHRLLHVWVSDGERREDLFDALDGAEYRDVVRVLELHMRRSQTYVHTTDPEIALTLAQTLATIGRVMPAATTPASGPGA